MLPHLGSTLIRLKPERRSKHGGDCQRLESSEFIFRPLEISLIIGTSSPSQIMVGVIFWGRSARSNLGEKGAAKLT